MKGQLASTHKPDDQQHCAVVLHLKETKAKVFTKAKVYDKALEWCCLDVDSVVDAPCLRRGTYGFSALRVKSVGSGVGLGVFYLESCKPFLGPICNCEASRRETVTTTKKLPHVSKPTKTCCLGRPNDTTLATLQISRRGGVVVALVESMALPSAESSMNTL